MSIPFTQYLRPDGEKRDVEIERPAEIEALAQKLIAANYVFEIEVLNTGEISMEVIDYDGPICGRICNNGPAVPIAVDEMIKEAYAYFESQPVQISYGTSK